MATVDLPAGAPPVGILGSVLGHLDSAPWYVNHRCGVYLFFCLFATTLNHAVRTLIPYFKKHYPLRMHYSKLDILKLFAINIISILLYTACIGDSVMPRFKDGFVSSHRLSLTILSHVVYTAVYWFCEKYVMTKLPQDQIPAQSANVVRIGVKTSLFVWWCLSGQCFALMSTHPLELTSEIYWQTSVVTLGINSLYTWELLFRDLRPVNIIHHAIACMGFTSMMEWSNLLEPTRVATAMPVVGSLIETFVCMGSVAYRFMPKGKALSRLLLAVTVFVLISYNLLLIGFLAVFIGYFNLYGFWYGHAGMPCLALFTYPAQMNMAKVFYSLYKKSQKEVKSVNVVETVENTSFTNKVLRRRQ